MRVVYCGGMITWRIQEVSVDGSHLHVSEYNGRNAAWGVADRIARNGSPLLVAVHVIRVIGNRWDTQHVIPRGGATGSLTGRVSVQ